MTRLEILHTLQSMDRQGVTSKQSEAIDGAIQFLDIGLDGDEASHAYEQGFKDGMADERRRVLAKVEEIIYGCGIDNAYDRPSFWCHNHKDYKVIPTNYHKGYDHAVCDIDKKIKAEFGIVEDAEPIHPLLFEDEKEVRG